MLEAAVVGRVNALAACGRCSWRHVHERLHHSANQPLSVGGDSNEPEVIGQLDEALDYFGSQDVMVLIEVIPCADCSVQVHDQNGIAPPVLREGALSRQVQARTPCELRLALLVAPSCEQIPAFFWQLVLSLELDVLVAEAVVLPGYPEAHPQLMYGLRSIAGEVAVIDDRRRVRP